jgi:hypothetical protein
MLLWEAKTTKNIKKINSSMSVLFLFQKLFSNFKYYLRSFWLLNKFLLLSARIIVDGFVYLGLVCIYMLLFFFYCAKRSFFVTTHSKKYIKCTQIQTLLIVIWGENILNIFLLNCYSYKKKEAHYYFKRLWTVLQPSFITSCVEEGVPTYTLTSSLLHIQKMHY